MSDHSNKKTIANHIGCIVQLILSSSLIAAFLAGLLPPVFDSHSQKMVSMNALELASDFHYYEGGSQTMRAKTLIFSQKGNLSLKSLSQIPAN